MPTVKAAAKKAPAKKATSAKPATPATPAKKTTVNQGRVKAFTDGKPTKPIIAT